MTISTLSTPILIQAPIRERILTHAQRCLPNEACGLLGAVAGEALITRMVCVPSKAPHPRHFTMEPHAQVKAHVEIEANGGQWRAIWHSHPTNEAYPSAIDKQASLLWPGIMAIIVSLVETKPVIRAFTIHEGHKVEEHPIQWVTDQLP